MCVQRKIAYFTPRDSFILLTVIQFEVSSDDSCEEGFHETALVPEAHWSAVMSSRCD